MNTDTRHFHINICGYVPGFPSEVDSYPAIVEIEESPSGIKVYATVRIGSKVYITPSSSLSTYAPDTVDLLIRGAAKSVRRILAKHEILVWPPPKGSVNIDDIPWGIGPLPAYVEEDMDAIKIGLPQDYVPARG